MIIGNIPAAVSRPPTWYCTTPKINVNDYEPVIPQHFRFSGQVCKCATLYLLDISMYHYPTSQSSSLYMKKRLSRHYHNNSVCLFPGVGVGVGLFCQGNGVKALACSVHRMFMFMQSPMHMYQIRSSFYCHTVQDLYFNYVFGFWKRVQCSPE